MNKKIITSACICIASITTKNTYAQYSNETPINPCPYVNISTCQPTNDSGGWYTIDDPCMMECEEWLPYRGSPTSTTTNSSSHVITSNWSVIEFTACPEKGDYDTPAECTTYTIQDYTCETGYYGSPTSSSTGCTICPSNATCDGGPTFSCNKGYYKNGNSCTRCPSTTYSTTASSGATSITSCYIPSNVSITSSVGTYEFINNCYYTN